MRRSIMVEAVLVVAILGAVALWRFTPPPRAMAQQQSIISVHAHTEKVFAAISLTPDRAGRMVVTADLTAPGGTILTATEVSLSLAPVIEPGAPSIRPMTALGEGKWQASILVPAPGQWVLGLEVLIGDFEKTYLETRVSLR